VVAGNADASADPLLDGRLGRRVDPASEADLVAAIEASFETRVPPGAVERFSRGHFQRTAAELLDALRQGRFAARGPG
jgi:hypothetical protein